MTRKKNKLEQNASFKYDGVLLGVTELLLVARELRARIILDGESLMQVVDREGEVLGRLEASLTEAPDYRRYARRDYASDALKRIVSEQYLRKMLGFPVPAPASFISTATFNMSTFGKPVV